MNSKEAFYYWFAGLLDGEGSFVIYTRRTKTAFVTSLILSVTLRADDIELLEECRREFGGSVQHRASRGENWAPTCVWSVRKRDDCRQLLDILDAYPLRSKKRNDYLLWREAVLLHDEFQRGGAGARAKNLPAFEKIEALKGQLNGQRKYKED